MILRPYQKRTVDACVRQLNSGGSALIQAPTGAGKSIILASIVKELAYTIPGFRCCLVIDREILVRQLHNTFTSITQLDVGVACASVQKEVEIDKQMVIASRQTLSNRLKELQPFNLIIYDEAHLVPLQGDDHDFRFYDQYTTISHKFLELNSKTRLLGCSATPWRLDSGYIYGNVNRADLTPWWGNLTAKITFSELTADGHLCRLNGMIAKHEPIDLSSVRKVGYEYNLKDLSVVMCKFVNTVNQVIEEELQNHSRILVFACTIEHCEEIKRAVPNSETLHSKRNDQQEVLGRFAKGEFRVLISVNKLSIGFDMPMVSAAVMARPTMASALFVQMVGRILRPYEGKEVATLIDLTDNTTRHCPDCDLDNVMVKVPRPPGDGIAPVKFCEAKLDSGMFCMAENHPSTRYCTFCGAEFPAKTIPKEYMPELVSAEFGNVDDCWYDVEDMQVAKHISKKNGKRIIRVMLYTPGLQSKTASVWICTADEYDSKFAIDKGAETWSLFTDGTAIPHDFSTAFWLATQTFRKPARIFCSHTPEGYLNVKEYDFEEIPF